jgi:hypothetical protein
MCGRRSTSISGMLRLIMTASSSLEFARIHLGGLLFLLIPPVAAGLIYACIPVAFSGQGVSVP